MKSLSSRFTVYVLLDFPPPGRFQSKRHTEAAPTCPAGPRARPAATIQIRAVLSRASRGRRPRVHRSKNMTVSSQVSEKAATILVVEDDERMREGLRRAFESEGHRVLACGDAAEA